MTTMKNHLHRKLRCSIAGRILIEKVGDIGGSEQWSEAELNATHLELVRSEEGTKSFKTAFQNFLANLKS